MITDLSDILFWWDAADGLETMIGGDPVFTRAGSGTVVPTEAGMVHERVADIPRYPYVELRRLRKNLLTRSAEFDDSDWTKNNVTVTADQDTAPDGETAGDLMKNTAAGAGSYHYVSQGVDLVQNEEYAVSCYVKYEAGSGWVWLIARPAGSYIFAFFDVQNGAKGTATGWTSTDMEDVGDGWYRISGTFTRTGADSSEQHGVGVSEADNTPTWDSTGAANQEQVYLWGAHLEPLGYAGSYIATEGLPVTEKHDTESLPALLLEAAGTNLCLDSEDLNGANWTASNCTVTADDAVAPDGQQIAHKLTDASGAAAGYVYQDFTVANDSLDHAVAVFIRKSDDSNNPVLELYYLGGGGVKPYYRIALDRATGDVALSTAHTATDGGAIEVGDYWLLWLVAPNNGAGNTTLRIYLYPAFNDNDPIDTTYEVAAQGSIHAWGFDVKKQKYPDSYTGETEGSSVARVADDLYWTDAPKPQAMCIYMDLVLVNPLSKMGGARFFEFGDGSDPRLFIDNPSGGTYIGLNYDNGTLKAAYYTVVDPAVGDRIQLVAYLASDTTGRLIVSKNGGTAGGTNLAISPDGMASAWSAEKLGLNSTPGDSVTNAAKYRRLVIVKSGNLDAALDGTEDDELIAELAEIEVNEDRTLTSLY